MNKCIFTGRLSREPETKQSQSGMTVTKFGIAVDRMKTKNNPNPGADFLSCVAFGSTGDFISKYFHKGNKIILETHVQVDSFDGQNGKVYTTSFIVDNVEFGESKNSQGNSQNNNQNNNQASVNDFVNVPDTEALELPFC